MEVAQDSNRQKISPSVVLPVLCLLLFVGECLLFRYSLVLICDFISLFGLTFVWGVLAARLLSYRLGIRFSSHETIAVGSAIGFGLTTLSLELLHSLGCVHAALPLYLLLSLGILLLIFLNRPYAFVAKRHRLAWDHFFIAFLFVLLFIAVYNLRQFHYLPDGSIVTRGLFGVDLPFLAGEIHGIQDYGVLRDLHQLALPWHYHEATYQLLALLPRANTLSDLSFIAPLFGYTVLAFALFTLVFRATANEVIATGAIAGLFLLASFTGSEQGSYALSPSFVFGTMIWVASIICLDHFFTSSPTRFSFSWTGLFLFLFLTLSQTKLTTYLAAIAGIVCLWTMMWIRHRRHSSTLKPSLELLLAAILSFAIVLLQSLSPNPLMPGGDFLVGAPLLGYANHLAAILHISTDVLNPVSKGLQLRPQSLLIIPFFLFHFLRFAITDPRILIVIVCLFVFRRSYRSNDSIVLSSFTVDYLLLLIPIGFLLPVLYSPAWYPLALSFYTPLVSIQSALVLMMIGLSLVMSLPLLKSRALIVTLFGILLVIGVLRNTYSLVSETAMPQDTVHLSLISAMKHLAALTPNTMLLVSHRFDFGTRDTLDDESYYWYSALSGHPVVSEGAKYGSLLGADADIDPIKGLHCVAAASDMLASRRMALDTIYYSTDSARVNQTLGRLGAEWLLEDSDDSLHAPLQTGTAAIYDFAGLRLFRLHKKSQ